MSVANRQDKNETEQKLIEVLGESDDILNRRPPCMEVDVYDAKAMDVEFSLSTYQLLRHHVEYDNDLTRELNRWLDDEDGFLNLTKKSEWAHEVRRGTAPYSSTRQGEPVEVHPGRQREAVIDNRIQFVAWDDEPRDGTYIIIGGASYVFRVWDYAYFDIGLREVNLVCIDRNCSPDYLNDRQAGMGIFDERYHSQFAGGGVSKAEAERIVGGQGSMFDDCEYEFFEDKAVLDEENDKIYCSECLTREGKFTELKPMGLLEF